VQGDLTSASQGKSVIKVIYDAPSQTYQITSGSRSQSFRPGDIVSQNATTGTVYQRSSSGTTDSLTLVKAGASSLPDLTYVGGGFWQRSTQSGSSSGSGSFDAFAYGIETPDASLPRTGAGHYGITLTGVIASGSYDYPLGISGSGGLDVDFAAGLLQLSGNAAQIDPVTQNVFGSIPFTGSASISSSANSFTGSFGYNQGVHGLSGGLDGRFYGPHAEEIGAAVHATNVDGDVMVGAILGQQSGSSSANLTLANLQSDISFNYGDATDLNSYGIKADGTSNGGMPLQPALVPNGELSYVKATDTWTTVGNSPVFAPANKVSGDPRFTTYQVVDNGHTYQLKLYKPGAGNSELALSYVSFGHWSDTWTPGAVTAVTNNIMVFGLGTPLSGVPHTGSGHYTGLLYGTAASTASGGGLYMLSGAATFDWNFLQQSVSGTLSPVGKDITTAEVRSFGTLTLPETFGSDNMLLGATLTQSGSDVGKINLRMYGPAAEEIGGAFKAAIADDRNAGQTMQLSGVTVGKR
jgi:hypothetical protein